MESYHRSLIQIRYFQEMISNTLSYSHLCYHKQLFLTGVICLITCRNSVCIQYVSKRSSKKDRCLKCVKQYFTFAMNGLILSLLVFFQILQDGCPYHRQTRTKEVLWFYKHIWKTRIWEVSSAKIIFRNSSRCAAPLVITTNGVFCIHVLLMCFGHT